MAKAKESHVKAPGNLDGDAFLADDFGELWEQKSGLIIKDKVDAPFDELDFKDLWRNQKIEIEAEKASQEAENDRAFDGMLHKKVMDSLDTWWWWLWSKDGLETKFTQILPAIRVQHIREWKNVILDKEASMADIEKRAQLLSNLVIKFDDILKEKQNREQKSELLNKLLFFFWVQTIALFGLVFLAGLKTIELNPVTLDILIGATILQVAGMLAVIVFNLYPSERGDVEKLYFEKMGAIDRNRTELVKDWISHPPTDGKPAKTKQAAKAKSTGSDGMPATAADE